jgi:hypothetical protein
LRHAANEAPGSFGLRFESDSNAYFGVTEALGHWPIARTVTGKALGDCGCHPGDTGAGDPISVATGNVYETVTDYRTAGANRLEFTRFYNGLAGALSLAADLGPHWRSTYDRYLRIPTDPSATPSVTAERPDGRELRA